MAYSKLFKGSSFYFNVCIGTSVSDNFARLFCTIDAYRTSPIESLYTESDKLPLKLCREKLALQYTLKIAANPDNPI